MKSVFKPLGKILDGGGKIYSELVADRNISIIVIVNAENNFMPLTQSINQIDLAGKILPKNNDQIL